MPTTGQARGKQHTTHLHVARLAAQREREHAAARRARDARAGEAEDDAPAGRRHASSSGKKIAS